jgi:hypothetical protein
MPKSDKPCISPRIYHMYTEEDEAKEEATSLRRQGYSSVRTFWRTVNAGGASARYLVVVVYTLRNDGAHTWRSLEHSPTQVCTVCGARRRHPASHRREETK